jgi:VanZ family protein
MRGALALTVLFLLVVLLPWSWSADATRTNHLRLAVAVACNVLLVLLIVVPWQRFDDHLHWERVRWIPFVSPPINARDLLGNVILYVPLGHAAARLIGAPRGQRLAVAGAAVLALLAEVSQAFSENRYPSATDLVCNTFGAWLGSTWPRRAAETVAQARAVSSPQ